MGRTAAFPCSAGPLGTGPSADADHLPLDGPREVVVAEAPARDDVHVAPQLGRDRLDVVFSLGIGEDVDTDLSVPNVPKREKEQVCGIVHYDIEVPSGTIEVDIVLENASCERGMNTDPYDFQLEREGIRTGHSSKSCDHPDYIAMRLVAEGDESPNFTLVFDKPIGWDDEGEMRILWNGSPERCVDCEAPSATA